MRDDFPAQVKEVLAKRVGDRCSNPDCRKSTSGPRTDPRKAISIGVAAHITAASPGGPRYSSSLDTEARRSVENGLWLCQSCSKLIDTDGLRYPTSKLFEWKLRAEAEALKRLEGIQEEELRPSRFRILAPILLLCIGALYLGRPPLPNRPIVTPSIVVEPFENKCPGYDYLATSLPDEIVDQMASLKAIRVLSPEASQSEGGLNFAKMRERKIDYVLQGTIHCRTEPASLVIALRLIRTDNENVIGVESYESLDQLLRTPLEIANWTTNWLLPGPRSDGLQSKSILPTENPAAYQAYLRGIGTRSTDKRDSEQQVKWFRQAIEMDPRFALAYARLAQANLAIYENGYDRSPERLYLARQAFEKSLEINPGNSQGRLAKAIYFYVQGAFEVALDELQDIRQDVPKGRVLVRMLQGFSEWSLGRPYEAVKFLQGALNLEPDNAVIAWNLGNLYREIRRFEDADRCYTVAIAVMPDSPNVHLSKSWNYLRWSGSASGARSLLPPRLDWTSQEATLYLFGLDMLEKKYTDAVNRLRVGSDEAIQTETMFAPVDLLVAEAYRFQGDLDAARVLYRRAISLLRRQVDTNPDDPRTHSAMGVAYAALGNRGEAIKEATDGVRLCKDKTLIPYRLLDLAYVYTTTGNNALALTEIERLLAMPSPLTIALLRVDPRWEPLRRERRFEQMAETSLQPETAPQREE